MKAIICTASGIEFDLLDPQPSMVRIEDIAHGLSHVARFAGHTREFYSVAQHSCLVFDLVRAWDPAGLLHQRVALLHDAAEAYVGDVTTPLKTQLAAYRRIEDRIRDVIFRALDCPWRHDRMPGKVKTADRWALYAERRDLMPDGSWLPLSTGPDVSNLPPLNPYSPGEARAAFLSRWALLDRAATALTA